MRGHLGAPQRPQQATKELPGTHTPHLPLGCPVSLSCHTEWDKGLDNLQQYLDALDNKVRSTCVPHRQSGVFAQFGGQGAAAVVYTCVCGSATTAARLHSVHLLCLWRHLCVPAVLHTCVCADTFVCLSRVVLQAVLGANIDFQGHKLKDKVKPYVVKQVKGKKVGHCTCAMNARSAASFGATCSMMVLSRDAGTQGGRAGC